LKERPLSELAGTDSPASLALARTVLEQDLSDAGWAAQIGPALAQRDAARLLGISEQAVSRRRDLLRIRNRDGRPVYHRAAVRRTGPDRRAVLDCAGC
jgi:hypothetical protein